MRAFLTSVLQRDLQAVLRRRRLRDRMMSFFDDFRFAKDSHLQKWRPQYSTRGWDATRGTHPSLPSLVCEGAQ